MYQARHLAKPHKRPRKPRKKGGSVLQAAGMLTVMMALSRVLGFGREISVSSTFGISWQADAYNAAFSIPDLIYFALVGGALSSAFIPVFSSYLATDQEEDGYVMASTILNIVGIAALVLIALGLVFTPQLVRILVDFSDERTVALTIFLTRLMFAQCFFMCIAGISQGILQCYKEFTVPALGAVIYNVAIIAIGLLFHERLGITGFTVGVVVGAALNLLIQIPAMRRNGFSYRFVLDLRHPGVRRFFLLLLPVVLGLSMNEINLLVVQKLASGLDAGAITALKQAQRIMMLPVGIFAAAIGLSFFPTMTSHVARGELDAYKDNLTMGLRTIIFITLPASVGLMVLSYPVTRAMYLQFAVTQESVQLLAVILVYYAIGIVGYSAQQILNRGFYAVQDTKSPVLINGLVLLCNILFSVFLVRILAHRGLALAYSLSGLLSMAVLSLALRRKIGPFGGRSLLRSALQSAMASAVMGVVVYGTAAGLELVLDTSGKLMQIGQVCVCVAVGAAVYLILAVVLRMQEAQLMLRLVKRKIGR